MSERTGNRPTTATRRPSRAEMRSGAMRPRTRVVIGVAVWSAATLVLVGCVGRTSIDPSSTPGGAPNASAEPSIAPSASPGAPTFDPGGSASDNLDYFDRVNSTFLVANPTPGGRAIIDNLVGAGFPKPMMQVTPDLTAIGGTVDAVQFSVRFGDSCLIGQSSPAGYVGIVGPAVNGTACLVGKTRTIDW